MYNRIKEYIKDMKDNPEIFCVVVSDLIDNRVILSYKGEKIVWEWRNGLHCPGSSEILQVHPLAAQALITEELNQLFRMEGIESESILYVDSGGSGTEGVEMAPPELGNITSDILYKRDVVQELYEQYLGENDGLTEEIIGKAIGCGVLTPLLSLVNLG